MLRSALFSVAVALATAQSSASAEAPNTMPTVSAWDVAVLRDMAALRVSPDGAWAAFQIRQAFPRTNRYETTWHVIATNGAMHRILANGGEPIQPARLGRVNGAIVAAPPVWSLDSRWIAYLRKEGGTTQIWRSRRDGGRTEQLTSNARNVRALAYSRDGRSILFETEPTQSQIEAALAREGRAGFLYDRRFFPTYSPRPVMPADVMFGNGAALLQSPVQINAREVWLYDLRSRSERPATEAERAEFSALTRTPGPPDRFGFRGEATASANGGLVWAEARDPEKQGGMAPMTIVAQPASMGAPIVCLFPECTGQSIKGLWWRNDDEIIFARGAGPLDHDTAFYAWTPGITSPRLILRTPSKLTSYAGYEWTCAVARDHLVCFYEQADYPRRLVAVDLVTGAIEILYDPNPEFARFNLGSPPQRIDIRTPSGVETYGYLVLPPHRREGERLPLIIVTYRCAGFLRGGTGDEYPIYPFAAQGFAVLCFNAPDRDYERLARMNWTAYQSWSRGSGDPEKHSVQEALNAAVTTLDDRGIIDRGRVGLTGLSFGAEMVSFALFNMPHIAATVASGTEIGPSSAFLYGPAGRDLIRGWGLGSPTSDRWRTLSLSLNANRARAPLLLNVGDHEMLAALEAVAAIEEAGGAVEMYVFSDEHHIKFWPEHRLHIYERNIDWMNFWLRGAEDPELAKAAQYVRWRGMRERGVHRDAFVPASQLNAVSER